MKYLIIKYKIKYRKNKIDLINDVRSSLPSLKNHKYY